METDYNQARPEERQPYEPPRIEEELEFETAALGGCALKSGETEQCDLHANLS